MKQDMRKYILWGSGARTTLFTLTVSYVLRYIKLGFLILTMCSLPGKNEHPLSKWGSNHLIRVAGIK